MAVSSLSEERVGDDELIAAVEQGLHETRGATHRIRHLMRRVYRYQSSYPLEELIVLFEGGEQLNLIFKNVNPESLSPVARRAKPDFLDDPRREIGVYRSILDAVELGTPRYYGSLMDDDQKRYWLFLEIVAGEELYQIGETTLWLAAARWLARFHERFAGLHDLPELTARTLTKFDAPYYQRWFDNAVRFTRERNARDRRRTAIEHLAKLAPQIIDELLGLPATLIHGEFYASNVLVNNSRQPVRVCPVDWERAATGPGLIDLAALTAGSWPEEFKRQMLLAYQDEMHCTGSATQSCNSMLRGLNLCRLQLAVQWLGWSDNWTAPKDHRHDWLVEALTASEQLGLTT